MSQEEQAEKVKGLTVAQMRDLCAAACKAGKGHAIIRIPVETGRVSIGSSPSVDVIITGGATGFDWNSRSYFLETAEPISLGEDRFQALKERTQRASETIYWLSSILKDEKTTAEQKLAMVAQRVANYTTKEPKTTE